MYKLTATTHKIKMLCPLGHKILPKQINQKTRPIVYYVYSYSSCLVCGGIYCKDCMPHSCKKSNKPTYKLIVIFWPPSYLVEEFPLPMCMKGHRVLPINLHEAAQNQYPWKYGFHFAACRLCGSILCPDCDPTFLTCADCLRLTNHGVL